MSTYGCVMKLVFIALLLIAFTSLVTTIVLSEFTDNFLSAKIQSIVLFLSNRSV